MKADYEGGFKLSVERIGSIRESVATLQARSQVVCWGGGGGGGGGAKHVISGLN